MWRQYAWHSFKTISNYKYLLTVAFLTIWLEPSFSIFYPAPKESTDYLLDEQFPNWRDFNINSIRSTY